MQDNTIPKIKICGLTRLIDAQKAFELGADYLGFIFVERSPRHISIANAREIIAQLPSSARCVGVFQDATAADVQYVMRECRLHSAQLHGKEPAEVAKVIGPERVWKAINLDDPAELAAAADYPAAALLADAMKGTQRGGTGATCNWEQAADLAKKCNLLLAGGLGPDNIVEAWQRVQPWALDLSSGVEAAHGIKNHAKLEALFNALQQGNIHE